MQWNSISVMIKKKKKKWGHSKGKDEKSKFLFL